MSYTSHVTEYLCVQLDDLLGLYKSFKDRLQFLLGLVIQRLYRVGTH